MAPPEIINRRNNRIIQRPFGFFFVGVVMGSGSLGWRGGSSMPSIGGIGAPGGGGIPGKGGSAGGSGSGSSRVGYRASKSVSPGASGILPIQPFHDSSIEESVNGVIRTPTAPAEYAASSAKPILPLLDTKTMRAFGSDSLISSAATWPSRVGISTAMNTKSGLSATNSSTALSPSLTTSEAQPRLRRTICKRPSVIEFPITMRAVLDSSADMFMMTQEVLLKKDAVKPLAIVSNQLANPVRSLVGHHSPAPLLLEQ